MTQYRDFIPQNVAPLSARRIGVYNAQGNRVGQIPLGTLTPPMLGKKSYSFGVLSDVHIGDSTSTADFTAALKYLSTVADFICISGDLVHWDSDSLRSEYKKLVDTYATIPVYMGYFDWGTKRISRGQKVELTDDARADMERIQAMYEEMHLVGKHPDMYITH